MRFFANHAARMIAMRKRTRYIAYNALEGANHMILYDLLRFSHYKYYISYNTYKESLLDRCVVIIDATNIDGAQSM